MSDLFNEMLKAYEATHEGKRDSGSQKTYDLKNYFNTSLPKGVDEATKRIRILPPADGETLFWDTLRAHKRKIDGQWKTLPCLKHELNEDCPFCEAREALLSTGDDGDKELAKEYSDREYYIIKVIDRDNEDEGVKFWRIPRDYRKQGTLDKIMKAIRAVGHDITDVENGRDLNIEIARDFTKNKKDGIPMIQAITYPLEKSPLSTNQAKIDEWTSDTRTWKDVYSIRNYDYLKIVVKGDVPVWDKESKKYVGKLELEAKKGSDNQDDDTDVLEQELEMGLKDKPLTTPESNSVTTSQPLSNDEDDEDGDDLPF